MGESIYFFRNIVTPRTLLKGEQEMNVTGKPVSISNSSDLHSLERSNENGDTHKSHRELKFGMYAN